MAFTHEGNIGTANSTSAGSTLTITTTAPAFRGDAVICWVAWDNNATADSGPYSDDIRCDDNLANDWQKLASGVNTVGGAADDGVQGAIFGVVLDQDLATGSTITLTHRVSAARVCKAASAHRFSGVTKANLIIAMNGVTSVHTDAGDPASISLSSMRSDDYLLLHSLATEGDSGDTFTQDSDYTSITSVTANGGTAETSVTIRGGFRIATLTGDTVDVALTGSRDHTQNLVAVRQSNSPFVRHALDITPSAMSASNTGTAIITLPSFNPGDIVMAFEAGLTTNVYRQQFNQADGRRILSHQPAGTDFTSIGFWKVLSSSDVQLDFQDQSDNNYPLAMIIGGCRKNGPPFHVLGFNTEGADTSIEFGGAATTYDEELIILWHTNGRDSTGGQVSAWTNTNLIDLEELGDEASTLGNGLGHAYARGYKQTAGSVGTTTATLAGSEQDINMTVAFFPKNAPDSASPWVKHAIMAEGTAAATASWNAGEVDAGDLIVALCETADQAITISGYTQFPNSPQSGTGTRMTAFYKVADGSETGLTTSDSGNHQYVIVLIVAGVDLRNPVDATAGGGENTSDTSVSTTGVTTNYPNSLVLTAMTGASGSNVGQVRDVQNANLAGFAVGTNYLEFIFEWPQSAGGADGTISVACGPKVTPGASGATTATLVTATTKAYMDIALKRRPQPPHQVFRVN